MKHTPPLTFPLMPSCDRCGMPYRMQQTRAHRACDRARAREDQRRRRELEREAREWIAEAARDF